MKRTSIYVDGRRKTASGEYSIYVRVFDELTKKSIKFSAGMTTPVLFKGREFPKTVPNADILTTRLNDVYRVVLQACIAHPDCSLNELKSVVAKLFGRADKNESVLLTDYIKIFMTAKNNPSTRSLYDQTLKKVQAYDAGITLDALTPEWLEGYEKYYRETMTVNGVAISLRNIRAVVNDAISKKVTTNYPFRQYRIKHEATKKRSLTVAQLRLLRDYKVDEWLEEYRDIFMLQFYLIGINISDLLLLKNLPNGRCVYRRKKTGRLYDIAVPKEAMKIINKYRGKKYLLCPLDRYGEIKCYTHHINDGLKKIGNCTLVRGKNGTQKVVYESLFPELSTYWARHTWATIAASLDIPKETIGKALGHSEWDSTTTDIYIDFDMKKIDEANRKVIDYLNSDLKKSKVPPKKDNEQGSAIILKMYG